MTYYLGIVDPAEDGTWGVTFPDLDGCYSGGRDMDDLFAKATEAVRMWAEEAMTRTGLPPARTNAELMEDPEVRADIEAAGPRGCLIQVPLLLDRGRTVRANISIEAGLLAAIDEAADRRGVSRSAFLATAARDRIESNR